MLHRQRLGSRWCTIEWTSQWSRLPDAIFRRQWMSWIGRWNLHPFSYGTDTVQIVLSACEIVSWRFTLLWKKLPKWVSVAFRHRKHSRIARFVNSSNARSLKWFTAVSVTYEWQEGNDSFYKLIDKINSLRVYRKHHFRRQRQLQQSQQRLNFMATDARYSSCIGYASWWLSLLQICNQSVAITWLLIHLAIVTYLCTGEFAEQVIGWDHA